MINRILTTTLLNILLGFALLIGLLPMSNQRLSMPTRRVEAAIVSQSDTAQENAGDHPIGSCCDAMSPFSPGCDFVISQCGYVAQYEGSKQVVNSDPVVQSIYIEAISPPPKA